ncbi:ATP-binding protein [Cronobacter turicensis]|nr:ATP-binding protein [Cronobacter turicensis]ELU8454094.1 ATP-binding protein [Cronobacter turicensis]ELY4109086.1 ATP-binding protein [Cronobacter turicensis]ELY4214189.1 ATP-binding protein [Cronobacter turicensis]EMA1790201.1 ATP-binding protein [Cronobacter turicensis]
MTLTARKIVITGGPGGGKSTLLDILARAGWRTSPETGRAIIQEQIRAAGVALPWGDREAFAAMMLNREERAWYAADEVNDVVFFDRGIPDIVGYLTLCGLPVPEVLHQATVRLRYDNTVFIAPPWKAIFTQDAERRQDFEEAVRTCEVMKRVYTRYGYQLAELPFTTPQARADWILAQTALIRPRQ